MTSTIEMPLWVFLLILAFALVTFASHFLFPSVRWFFRRRMERVVARLNTRLERPIQPFKLARRTDMIQRLVYDPAVTEAIVDHARETGVREDVAFEQAKRYAREIVPSFSATAYFGIAIRLARWLSTMLYHVRVGVYDQSTLENVDPDATVIFVMNHRSNMDYVLVTYLAAERSALSYAVGEWARLWPLSRLIRAMGAYFIRRRYPGALYRRVLSRYVALSTQAGVTQAMFPEGGLSLDGRLAKPRVGLLKYMIDGWEPGGRDVVFVPVALNYDRVLEDRVLMQAHKAGERKFRAPIMDVVRSILHYLWARLTSKFTKFGYAAVSFGAPISLQAFSQGQEVDPGALAEVLMSRIGAVIPVLPVPLVAAVLQDGLPKSHNEIAAAMRGHLTRLQTLPAHILRDTSEDAVKDGLTLLLTRNVIHRTASGGYQANPDELGTLAFYANSIAHLK